ncbi:MAG: penicillin-binding protein transpeptidase [Frankiales bacterium]|nr:penicillin-binding protein transpeptidase [Frankiales bacterium]
MLLVLAVVAGVLVVVSQRRAEAQRLDARARAAAEAFAAAAGRGDLAPAPLVDAASAQVELAAMTVGLGARPVVEVLAVRRTERTGSAELRWTWPFGPQGWTYTSSLPLSGVGDAAWSTRWSPDVLHPGLVVGDVLAAKRVAAPRADLLGRDGAPIVGPAPVVEVGVQPSRTADPAGLSRTLGDLLDVEATSLEKRIREAAPDAFVSVLVLRRSEYDLISGQLKPLPGTVFRESTRPLAPTRSFARALIGASGPATAELVEQSQGRLAAGDVTGLSGLQRTYDGRLGGKAGVRVEKVNGAARSELFAVPPAAGAPVQVTLDDDVQVAADAALASTVGEADAALVAIDVATGDLLAVANTPATGGNRAMTGQYAPGSTFKPATTLALLGTGLRPEEVVACPPTASADGRAFRNFEGGVLGPVPFRTAFAQSCNTAFVGLSGRLEPPALTAAAGSLGLGVPWQVGTDVFAGSVPVPATPVDRAAATIGQGRTLASPAAMAQFVATIARGSWKAPRLVLQPAPEGPAPAAPSAADPAALATLRDLMRQVVVDGTASALADVPGGPVHAKTGTAEFGTDSPPKTHAWVIGFQGGLAFAVLVEGGASGGAVAVPVAEAFLRGLPPTARTAPVG